jgi:hypothetical protein
MATIAVISFVVLAGGSWRFGALEKRISPVDASIATAARDLTAIAKQLETRRRKMIIEGIKAEKKRFLRFPVWACRLVCPLINLAFLNPFAR